MQAAIILALIIGKIQMRNFLIETKPAGAVDDAAEHAGAVGGVAGVAGADAGTDYNADTDYYDNSNYDYHGTRN